MLVYDTEENVSKKTTTFARDRGVLVAIVDINSGMWRVAREIFEVLQKELGARKKGVNEISIDIIQEVRSFFPSEIYIIRLFINRLIA